MLTIIFRLFYYIAMSLYDAIRDDDKDSLESLLREITISEYQRDNDKCSLLHLAAQCGNARLIQYFIKAGCDVNSCDKSGKIPLMTAVIECEPAKRGPVVRLLIDAGANIHAKDCNGDSTLNFCFSNADVADDLETAKILLDSGANVDNRGTQRMTPLHVAVSFTKTDSINFLLNNGASVHVIDQRKQTPLYAAVQSLQQFNDLECNDSRSYEMLKLLLEHGADPNAEESNGQTTFHFILKLGNAKAVRLFLLHGSDLGKKRFRSVMHSAAMNKSTDVLRFLLDTGNCKINERNDNWDTPLHEAVRCWNVENIKLLCARGADINGRNFFGDTPIFTLIRSLNDSTFEAKSLQENYELDWLMDVLIDLGADVNGENRHREILLVLSMSKVKRRRMSPYICLTYFVLRFIAKFQFLGKTISALLVGCIDHSNDLKSYYGKCMAELSAISNFTFYEGVPIMPIVLGDRKVIARYIRNEELGKAFEAIDFKKRFPIYGESLMRRFTIMRSEYKLRVGAVDVLLDVLSEVVSKITSEELVGKIVTQSTVETVISFLSVSDLEKLTKS